MIAEELIKALALVPANTPVRVVDMQQNIYAHLSDIEGTFDGCYDEYKLAYFNGKDTEDDYIPFFAIIVDDPEYNITESTSYTLN